MSKENPPLPKVVSSKDWQSAIDNFIEKEKELTRAKDALNAERRRLPMRKVEKTIHFSLIEASYAS